MFDTELLREEFDQILQAKRHAARQLDEMAAQTHDPDLRDRISELSSHAQRHVELTERLVELVS